MVRSNPALLFHGLEDRVPNKILTDNIHYAPPKPIQYCIDCGESGRAVMCPPCAEKLAVDVVSARLNNNKPTLKLFKVVVYPDLTTTRTFTVLLLAKGGVSAERNATKSLGMSDTGGRIKMTVQEIEGPFNDGMILIISKTQ